MLSMENVVYYCCVAKGGRIIQAYNGGDSEVENLATSCLKSAPPYHRWYAQSMGRRTYGFLMEDGFVYFAIADIRLANSGLLQFLEHVRDEFKNLAKNLAKRDKGLGPNLKISNLSSVGLQEQLVPVISQLITSLQSVSQTSDPGSAPVSSPYNCERYGYAEFEPATSTKVPLLGKNNGKQEKKPISFEMEEHRRSADRRCRAEPESSNQDVAVSVAVSPTPLQKDMSGSMRIRSASQAAQRKWCRLVRLVLIVDITICVILLLVWLFICQGLRCIK